MTVPDLEPRFLEPTGWRWGSFTNANGKTLRFGSISPASPSAVIVLLEGRGEYIEKYFETARDLYNNNLAIWIMDWQGQGKSPRVDGPNPERGNSPPFEDHVADLHEFITRHVQPASSGLPLYMLAQSMGGNIGLRYLHAHPETFKGAIFCAPMWGLHALQFLAPPMALALARILGLRGANHYGPGQHDWRAEERDIVGGFFSSDPVRSAVHNAWLLADPALQTGGVTYGWLRRALHSCMVINRPSFARAIRTACVIFRAGKDRLIDNMALSRVAQNLPHALLMDFPRAGHEMLMETDPARTAVLNTVLKMVKDRPAGLKNP